MCVWRAVWQMAVGMDGAEVDRGSLDELNMLRRTEAFIFIHDSRILHLTVP